MKKIAVLSILSIFFFLSACSDSGNNILQLPDESSGEGIPLYPKSTTIALDEDDRDLFIINTIGYDYLLFVSNTSIVWSEDIGVEVQSKLDEMLPENRWRLNNDWRTRQESVFSSWRKGDLELVVIILDNLDSDTVGNLQRRYGMSGPTPGSTLIVSHVVDRAQPLPDATATAQAESSSATATVEAISADATSTAQTISKSATATAEVVNAEATATMQAANIESAATAQAVSAAATATVSAQTTAEASVVLQQQLADLSDDFSSPSLADSWIIYRPDPNRWSLNSRPGMLHIVGVPSRDAGILNVFAQKVTYDDLDVIVRIESDNMLRDGQSIRIGFAPGEDDSSRAYTIALGLSFNRNQYQVYMWECRRESCRNPSNLGGEQINYQGQIYLKLSRRDKDYTGYYSFDGESWSFAGQARDFPILTDQVTLLAGGGSRDAQFDAYFDFIRYEIP